MLRSVCWWPRTGDDLAGALCGAEVSLKLRTVLCQQTDLTYRAVKADRKAAAGLPHSKEKKAFPRAEKELAAIRKVDGCSLVNWTDPEYPQTLLHIYDPPVLLYVRGDAQVLNLPSLSILGTRRPTVYGTQMAQRLGRELAARGLVIVSGLARGH